MQSSEMSPWAQSNRPWGGRGHKSQPGVQKPSSLAVTEKHISHSCLMAKGWCKSFLANTVSSLTQFLRKFGKVYLLAWNAQRSCSYTKIALGSLHQPKYCKVLSTGQDQKHPGRFKAWPMAQKWRLSKLKQKCNPWRGVSNFAKTGVLQQTTLHGFHLASMHI